MNNLRHNKAASQPSRSRSATGSVLFSGSWSGCGVYRQLPVQLVTSEGRTPAIGFVMNPEEDR